MESQRSKEIALISPLSNWMYGDIPYPPLGIAALSAMAQTVGLAPTIIDGQFTDHEKKLENFLEGDKALIVGISSTLLQLSQTMEIAHQIKSKNEDTIVMVGGAAASCMSPKDFFDYSGDVIDAIAIGEGDYTWLEIIQKVLGSCITKTTDLLEGIQGTAFKAGDEIIINSPRPRIAQLDDLPMPDLAGIRAQEYIDLWKKNGGFGSISIFPSRGCPFPCVFCDKSVFGKKFIHHSPERIVDEKQRIIESFNDVDEIFLFDDNLSVDKRVMMELCNELEKRHLDIEWSTQARVDTVDEEMLKRMYEAGCRHIYFGVETASEKLIEFLGKGFSIEQAEEAIYLSHKVGIDPGAFFIVGVPGETQQDIEATAQFIKKTRLGHVGLSVLTPFPGTQLYENTSQLIKPELLNKYDMWDDTRQSIYQEGTFETDPEVSIRYLNAVFSKMLKENKMQVDQSQFVINRYD